MRRCCNDRSKHLCRRSLVADVISDEALNRGEVPDIVRVIKAAHHLLRTPCALLLLARRRGGRGLGLEEPPEPLLLLRPSGGGDVAAVGLRVGVRGGGRREQRDSSAPVQRAVLRATNALAPPTAGRRRARSANHHLGAALQQSVAFSGSSLAASAPSLMAPRTCLALKARPPCGFRPRGLPAWCAEILLDPMRPLAAAGARSIMICEFAERLMGPAERAMGAGASTEVLIAIGGQ